MCVKFYIAWADLLKSQHLLAPAAAVYAHGLRAGAQPLALLEDHADLTDCSTSLVELTNPVSRYRVTATLTVAVTDYCERPAELFEMLFRQGVGTMCVKFYIAWADLLKSQHLLAPAAAVYAHGLRAGAQPLALLEDHAE
ncbi:hypothetical protein AHF37_09082 [Paragonimus kellicotti]|nr:hypothetical protein AHF37_09082 [Paragonimus kellicotti]